MGIAIPQVIAEDRASGAQIIDGSLKFERSGSNYLKKTISTTGNQKTFTVSFWFKKQLVGNLYQYFFTTEYLGSGSYFEITSNSDQFHVYGGSGVIDVKITRKLRDTNGWMHAVVAIDSTIATPATDRVKIYLNGERQEDYVAGSSDFPPQNHLFTLEGSRDWYVGTAEFNGTVSSSYYDGHMSNFYFVDGQALGPEEFGFTDPLTNTWRPKKYTGEFARSSPNDGTWNATSSLSTTDTISSSTPAGNAFDGDLTTRVQTTNAAAGIALTFAPNNAGINFTTSLEVYCDQGTNVPTATWNGNTVNPGQNQWVTVYSGAGELSSTYPLTINTETDVQYATLVGVRVDGEILIDGLNNTGVNSFHLPMDGNSPVGEDKSGNGNDWTPWYFGGSNSIEKATGALPILNTTNGGNTATVGVRTDATVAAGVGTCALALPLVGIATDVSNQIDSKSSQKNIILNGDPTGITTISNFYGKSYYFDGTGDYLNTTTIYPDLNFKTGDFTIEAWCYASSSARAGLWQLSYTSGGLRPDDLQLSCHYQNTKFNFGSAGGSRINGKEYSTNRWHHVAEVRKDGVISTYINGVLDQSWTDTNTYWEGDTYVCVGGYWNTSYLWNGYIQDFRVYNGVAKYTSDFIPASTNPNILPDTPSGVSGGSELAKIANGSVGFAGTSRLSVESTSDLDFSTNNFTIEGFFNKVTTTGVNQTLLASKKYYTAGNNGNWVLRITDNANIAFATYDGQSNSEFSEFPAPNGADGWHHFALVREGTGVNQTKFYYDGKLAGSMRVSKSLTDGQSNGIFIGHDDGPNNDLNGFLSNVRIVNGTAVYTSDFTPPTEPLTNITNTKLLCAQSTSEHKDITGRLYKSGTLYTTKADIIANATPLEGGETLDGDYLYYVPSGNELTRQQVFSANGAITNGDSSNSWSWMRHDGTNWIAITGGYTPSQFIQFYFDADDTSYQLDPNRDFYALTLLGGTSPSQHSDPAPTLRKQFVLDAAVIPSSTRQLIDRLYEPTVSNFNPFDTDINTVRGQETGYATLNPLATQKSGSITLSNGNLTATVGATRTSAYANLPFVGKMYYEVTFRNNAYVFGMAPSVDFNSTANTAPQRFIGESSGSYGVGDDGTVYNNGVSNYQGSSLSNTFGLNDCMGWAYDSDSGQFSVYKNGVLQGTFTASTSRTYYPAITLISSGAAAEVNFGQKPFKFPPPDGYQPLNNANVRPETVIARPDQYVGVTTYHGDNIVRTQKVGFKPDLVWLKDYSTNSHLYVLCDSVRGGANILSSNNDLKQFNNTGYIQGFESDGFRLGADTHVNGDPGTPYAYVAWAWKAGGEVGVGRSFMIDGVGFSTAGDAGFSPQAIPTSGSTNAVEIEPFKASISTETGFSIVHYKGSDNDNDGILHGLTQKPDLVIVKNMNRTQPSGYENYTEWRVWHSGFGDNRNLKLGSDGAQDKNYWADGNIYGHTSPDTSMRMVGSSTKYGVNYLNDDYIMYSWHNVPGLQKFGTFVGINNVDGPFIELGFRPAIIWVKRFTSSGSGAYNWVVKDSETEKQNPVSDYLVLDQINQTATGLDVDFLSNGFKIRNANGNMNANSANDQYIYCAWAEAPAVNLYGGQSNAR